MWKLYTNVIIQADKQIHNTICTNIVYEARVTFIDNLNVIVRKEIKDIIIKEIY